MKYAKLFYDAVQTSIDLETGTACLPAGKYPAVMATNDCTLVLYNNELHLVTLAAGRRIVSSILVPANWQPVWLKVVDSSRPVMVCGSRLVGGYVFLDVIPLDRPVRAGDHFTVPWHAVVEPAKELTTAQHERYLELLEQYTVKDK